MSQGFLDLAVAGRTGAAIEYALARAVSGPAADAFITDVLCPVQRHVGLLWQENHWNAAEEHATTAVVQEVVGALTPHPDTSASPKGRVLVACVEGEHHSIPARLGAARLGHQGWAVTFLGGSLPPFDVRDFAIKTEPDVVVLSCTRSLLLPAARLGVAALAEREIPVVVAGAGFGPTAAWSQHLGASGWIGPTADPTAVLEGELLPPLAVIRDEVVSELDLHLDDLVVGCMVELYERRDLSTIDITQITSMTDDLREVLAYVGVSLELDDRRVFDDYLAWLSSTLGSRQVRRDAIAAALEVAAAVTARTGLHQAASTLTRAARTR